MAVVAQEMFGRKQSSQSGERMFVVTGTDVESTAIAAVAAEAAATVNGLVIDDISVEEIEGVEGYLAVVRYTSTEFERPEVGESTFSFDTSGGTQNITQSLETIASYAAAGTAADFKGAINATPDGVRGVDIVVPQYAFEESHVLANATVDTAYKAALYGLTGKVNSDTFRGFSAGEVLFLGARGSTRGTEDWQISYRFVASPNLTGISVGDITGIAKKGWEYLWANYRDVEDATAKALVKRPVSAYVEKTYETGSFSGLGI